MNTSKLDTVLVALLDAIAKAVGDGNLEQVNVLSQAYQRISLSK